MTQKVALIASKGITGKMRDQFLFSFIIYWNIEKYNKNKVKNVSFVL